jgi:hypothetical protein
MAAFDWHHAPGLETLCVVSEDLGFFQALPGCPFEMTEPTPPGQVPCAFMLMIGELEVPVRYYLMRRPPDAIEPALLGPLLARTWAQRRGTELGETRPATAEQLARWGVEGAGSVQYRLAPGVHRDAGLDREETLALVRGDSVLLVAKSFQQAKLDPLAWALFNAASTQSISWRGPGQTLPPVASVWPATNVFVQPGVRAEAKPQAQALVADAFDGAEPDGKEEQALAAALRGLVGGSEPLAQPLTPEMKQTLGEHLKSTCESPILRSAIDLGLSRCKSSYDLRGFAILAWRALQ